MTPGRRAVPGGDTRGERDERHPRQPCRTRPGRSGWFSCLYGPRQHLVDRVDLDSHVADVAQALPRILGETADQEPSDGHRRCRRQGGPVRLAFEDPGDRVRDRVAREGDASRQHLVEHTAERPDVRALVDRQSARLLRAHVRGRAEDDPCAPPAVASGARVRVGRRPIATDGLGEAEVQHLDHAAGCDLDVRGLQVAMHDPLVVGDFEGLGDLARNRQRCREWESAASVCAATRRQASAQASRRPRVRE